MDTRFDAIMTSPENAIFKVVFFPDRIYHARYLTAARSPRYRYNVQEVRGKPDINVMKGQVFLDGRHASNFLRVEYRAGRLTEAVRERGRRVRDQVDGWIRLRPVVDADLDGHDDAHDHGHPHAPVMVMGPEANLTLHYDPQVDAHAVEVWETLDPPAGSTHDFRVLQLLGRDAPITSIAALTPALGDLKALRQVELAFSENEVLEPFGYHIGIEAKGWDNNYLSSHQEPRTPEPSSSANTIDDANYLVDFQRGWYIPQSRDIPPVRYRNAMMEPDVNADADPDNIIEMRWLLQREMGGSVVFFHEVTIPPGKVEGTHRHIGSEELYYIVSGEGVAYMRDGDDPQTGSYPLVDREVFGIGVRGCREVPVRPGSVVFTKSGGVHGIRNPGTEPLTFVAFLYHST